MIIWFIIGAVRGNTVSGWATIVISIWLLEDFILLGLGVVGEYIGKIYMEAKGRPRFRVEKILRVEVEMQKLKELWDKIGVQFY